MMIQESQVNSRTILIILLHALKNLIKHCSENINLDSHYYRSGVSSINYKDLNVN